MSEIKKLDACTDWTMEDIDYIYRNCERIATEKFKLDCYPNRIEIINSEQMLDAYCITPDHKLLKDDLTWVEAGSIKVGDKILGFDEEGPYREYKEATITQATLDQAPVYCVKLSSGKEFKVTKEHLWLVRQQKGDTSVLIWKHTDELRGHNDPSGYSPSRIPKVMDVWTKDDTRTGGWLAGIFDGEGNIVSGTLQKLAIAQNEGIVLETIKETLEFYGVEFSVFSIPQTEKCKSVNILGPVEKKLQFLGEISPKRLISKLSFDRLGMMKTPNYEEVVSITPIGVHTIVKIATSTKTFVCDGYPMHNSAVGMPIYYPHWSFGKQFVREQMLYKRGMMGLAYEIVINSDPCLVYLMEENTLCLQAIVIAHAGFGHNSVFKNNCEFKQWTDASSIISYLSFAKKYIMECEELYGYEEVEALLDACHALRWQGVDKYKRPLSPSKNEVERRKKERQEYLQYTYNDIWKTLPESVTKGEIQENDKFPKEPQENLLYFLEKHTPNLPTWKREIIRIVRKINQYFYPQMQTKVLNEGRATQIHFWTMNEMYKEGLVTDGFMLEFLHNHTNVIQQFPYNDEYGRGRRINPYALGFAIFEDIKRICIDPTEEDRDFFPDWAGCGDYVKMTQFAADNFKDDSFIQQFLSPKVIRDFRMFWILDDEKAPKYYIKAIHDKEGYKQIRDTLAKQYNISSIVPNIQVTNVDLWGDRSLELTYYSTEGHRLDEKEANKTLQHLQSIWGYTCSVKGKDEEQKVIQEFSMVKERKSS